MYGVSASTNAHGRVSARVTFPNGVKNDDTGRRMIRLALDSAKRLIRSEVVAAMAPEPVARLAYTVTARTVFPSTRDLHSITLSEVWPDAPEPNTRPIPVPPTERPPVNGVGAFR